MARKIAARVRPSRSDSDSNDGPSEGNASANIIQFNCPDTLDFSSGSVVLPLRITCYCRHHREKVGFNVRFMMKDDSGRIVGTGMTPPIMITDDHKSTDKSTSKQQPLAASYLVGEPEWEPRPPMVPGNAIPQSDYIPAAAPAPAETTLTSRRRQSSAKDGLPPRKRAKPYDAGRPTGSRAKRTENSEGNPYPNIIPAPAPPAGNPYPDLSAFEHLSSAAPSVYNSTAPPSPAILNNDPIDALPSPPNSFGSPISPQSSYFETDALMREVLAQPSSFLPLSPPNTAPSSPPVNDALVSALSEPRVDLASFTYALFQPQPEPPIPSLPAPKIHRLIPSTGPTYGGIEVTVLGSNFHASVIYNCVFGDVVAGSTTRWSDNTLVCILPPRVTPGVVPVTLENIKLDNNPATEPVLFTYTDENDRTLYVSAIQLLF